MSIPLLDVEPAAPLHLGAKVGERPNAGAVLHDQAQSLAPAWKFRRRLRRNRLVLGDVAIAMAVAVKHGREDGEDTLLAKLTGCLTQLPERPASRSIASACCPGSQQGSSSHLGFILVAWEQMPVSSSVVVTLARPMEVESAFAFTPAAISKLANVWRYSWRPIGSRAGHRICSGRASGPGEA
jgi:hypothetical protein